MKLVENEGEKIEGGKTDCGSDGAYDDGFHAYDLALIS